MEDKRTTMETREFLNQKRIGLVNKFYYQVLEIKKNEGEPDIPLLLKEVVEDFDNFVSLLAYDLD